MFTPFNLAVLLIVLGLVLVYAILLFRQQRELSEKKALLRVCRKEMEKLKQRSKTVLAELARAKPEYKKLDWNLKLLRMELGEIRDEIRECIENIRKDSGEFSDATAGSLSRVIVKRKEILKEKLQEYKNRKSICLERQQIVSTAKNAVNKLKTEQDENSSRLEYLVKQIKQIELEFEALSSSSFRKFSKLWKRR